MRNGFPFPALSFDRGADRTVGAAPADDQQVAFLIAFDQGRGDVVGDAVHLGLPHPDHEFVILRIVADISGDVFFLQTADPVFQPRRSGNRPGAGERPFVPHIRLKTFGVCPEFRRDIGQGTDRRNHPGLGAVGKVSVGEDDHRGHVFDRNPDRLKSRQETVRRRARGDHGDRRLAVSSIQCLKEIGLLGLRGQPGARAPALNIADDQRKLEHHGEPHRLGFQSLEALRRQLHLLALFQRFGPRPVRPAGKPARIRGDPSGLGFPTAPEQEGDVVAGKRAGAGRGLRVRPEGKDE